MAFVAPLIGGLAAGGATAAVGGSLATALAVGSAAITGLSVVQQMSYQRSVAKSNAREAEYQANVTAEATQQDQLRSDREYRAMLAEQQAGQSTSGISLDSRSSREVLANTLRVRGEAVSDINKQGAYAIRGLQQDTANFRGEARMAKANMINAIAGTAFSMGKEVAKDKKLSKSLVGAAKSVKGLF